ncbi:MAG: DUF2793 domain-containing protein [Jannaschia helgolandensis]|uniref:DUF2793 domain-containing protein n=1 Tax=Jannaschia helgolandensis TaxID=188906 RepID=A0A1H7GGS4_9RHOB|nr:DUF2793 domain-containing protein [Jannaschia helgolandensis]SEK34985.1 Protein of unknown function [Jannaschia helgolandensis]
MSENTTILSLPLIQGGQAQKHITHNEAIRRLDTLVQPVVADVVRTAPPTTPNEGDRHIVAIGATGDWAGQDGSIAVRQGDAWAFISPRQGWRVHVIALGADIVFDGTTWGTPEIGLLGINAAADTTNRLAVASDATLLTHDAAGDHQLKINKATTGDSGSLLFQTGYSGRAEMGCAGEDGFSIKVSADGTTFANAMTVDPASGRVAFPSGAAVPTRAQIGGRWYCYSDLRWVTYSASYGVNSGNHDQDGGTGTEPDVNWSHLGLRVEAGTRITRLIGSLRPSSPQITGYDMRLTFQYGDWSTGWSDDAGTTRTVLFSADNQPLQDGWSKLDERFANTAIPQDGHVLLYLKPRGILSATQYIYTSLQLDMIPPA